MNRLRDVRKIMPEANQTEIEEEFWEPKTLEAEDSARWTLGPLSLWVRRRRHEWWVYAERDGANDLTMGFSRGRPPKETAAWKRWAFTEGAKTVRMVPVTPNRSVVARPETGLRIPPGNEVVFFVSIPFWLQIWVGEEQRTLLTEETARVLSNTWFGEPTEGELCYSLKTGASRSLEGVKRGSYRFVCPLVTTNQSTEELNFQKVCLPVPYLQLYRGERRLWSNRISLSYLGKSRFSAVAFDAEPPEYENVHGPLGEPRLRERKGFFRRSFESLRSFGF